MPYSKTTWIDRLVQFPNRFTKSGETSTEVTLVQSAGTVTNAGTPLSAANLNKIENGIANAVEKTGDTMTGVLNVVTGSVTAPAIAPAGDSNTGIFFPSADTVAIGEGGTEAMRINSSGNVGIGTTNPTSKLTVVGSANVASDGFGPASFNVDGTIESGSANITTLDSVTTTANWLAVTNQAYLNELPNSPTSGTNKQYVDNVSVGSQIYSYKNLGGAL